VSTFALDVDAVLGDTRPLWRDWLADAARRFAAIAPLDVDALPEDRAAAAEVLDRWAEGGVGDWRASLERFALERAPLHFRPDAATGAALRRLGAANARLGAFTDAPEELARVAAAQLGAARRLDTLVCGSGAEARVLAQLGAGATVVRSRAELTAAAE
jgi:phosphoglycolate phosphatase-like HAD superfamily hydrolase